MELVYYLQWTHDNVFGPDGLPDNADEIINAGNAALADYAERHGLSVYNKDYNPDDAEQLRAYGEVLFGLLCDTGAVLPKRAEIMLNDTTTE